ncbi:MAG: hypothetical protein LBV62_00130 [Rickettsiales bacterium]|jgi:hypothetical protein|nr:hypothetical protein [Rickettsiales bacterium]
MTTALSLGGLPAGRKYGQINTKEEPVINEAMMKKFIACLGVSKITLANYEYD